MNKACLDSKFHSRKLNVLMKTWKWTFNYFLQPNFFPFVFLNLELVAYIDVIWLNVFVALLAKSLCLRRFIIQGCYYPFLHKKNIVRISGKVPPLFAWHNFQIIMDALIVNDYVLNQSNSHWLFFDAL